VCLLDLSSGDSAYSRWKARTAQGKPVERRGRKATGLRIDRCVDHDSGVARMYNTNLSVLRPTSVGIILNSASPPLVVSWGALAGTRLRCDLFAGKRLIA
jgi:hypothetical protein